MERGSGRRRRRLLPVAALGALTGLLPLFGGAATLPSAQAVQRPWWPAAMGFDDLHRAGGTGRGITIAVLDDVIDPTAADIRGRVASTESVCWEKTSTATTSAADHATEIAQLLVGTGASANGMPGVRGIAPQATLRHYTIGYGDHLRCTPGDEKHINTTDAAITKALADGAKIISMSYGKPGKDDDVKRAVTEALHAGAILVGATGKVLDLPSGYNGVVAVNACDREGKISSFAATPRGYGIGFCAPGVGMALGNHDKQGRWLPQGVLVDGSSYAAPLVAGGLAAYWSKYPDATANQVLQAAVHNPGMKRGTSVAGKKGWIWWYRREGSGFPKIVDASQSGYGWGIFDAADLMSVDPTTYPDVNPLVRDQSVDGPTPQEIGAGRLLTGSGTTSPPTTASATATTTATAARGSSGGSGGSAAGSTAPASSGSAGIPAWAWVAAVVLVLLAAGGAVMVTRRGSGARPTGQRQPGEGA